MKYLTYVHTYVRNVHTHRCIYTCTDDAGSLGIWHMYVCPPMHLHYIRMYVHTYLFCSIPSHSQVSSNPVPVQAGSNSDHAPSFPSVHTRSPDPQTPHPIRSINVAGRSSQLRPSQPLPDDEFYISIHKGVSAEDHPDFIRFKNQHLSEWGRCVSMYSYVRNYTCN